MRYVSLSARRWSDVRQDDPSNKGRIDTWHMTIIIIRIGTIELFQSIHCARPKPARSFIIIIPGRIGINGAMCLLYLYHRSVSLERYGSYIYREESYFVNRLCITHEEVARSHRWKDKEEKDAIETLLVLAQLSFGDWLYGGFCTTNLYSDRSCPCMLLGNSDKRRYKMLPIE